MGIDVSRFPSEDSEYMAFRAMMSANPHTVLDVGANVGQFGRDLRRFGFTGLVISFEPGAAAFAKLQGRASSDPNWICQMLAVGDQGERRQLNIAANDGASSSLLPMLDRHRQAAPEAEYVSTEMVDVARLDELASHARPPWTRPALKIDTQGFEREILAGCGRWLDEVVAVRLELSLTHLYEGSWLWLEAVDWLSHRGFSLGGLVPGFADPATGRLLQFDGVFVRETGADLGTVAGS